MQITVTKDQQTALLQIINQVNFPGNAAEMVVALKQTILAAKEDEPK